MLAEMVERLAASGIAARAAVADSWGAAHALARWLRAADTCGARRRKRRRCCGPCRSPRCACPATSSMACACSASSGSAIWRRSRARRWRCASVPSSVAGSTRRWDGSREPIDAAPPRRARRGSPRLRRADRRGRDHRALHRQAGRRALRGARDAGPRRAAARPDLHRWSTPAPPSIRVGTALPIRDAKRLTRLLCDQIETIDPGFGIELMSLTATLSPSRCVRKQTVSDLVEEPEPGCLRPDRHAGQPRRRAAALPLRPGRERRARTLGPARSARSRRMTGDGWPEHWPRPSRLLRHPEPIETVALLPDHPPVTFTWRGIRRRVKRADGPERVFGEWWKRDAELIAGARLFPGRGRGRRALLDLPRRRRRGRRDRLASLVPARDLRMSGTRYAELQVHLAFLLPARRELLRGAVRAGRRCSASRRWPSSTATALAGIVRAHRGGQGRPASG